jgi:hypothetical protein
MNGQYFCDKSDGMHLLLGVVVKQNKSDKGRELGGKR